ncbi:hypothetical protein KW471_07900 [Vibrio fluvialis]|nr:hypothetical protein [Vibrio fluvialis]
MSEEKIRFYHSSLNEHGHDRNKSNASDKHNCRFDPNNPNYDPSLTKDNLIYINGEKCNPEDIDDNYKKITEIKKTITDEFMKNANVNSNNEELKDTEKSELQLSRNTAKSKIKKWADDKENKLTPEEKSFWINVYNKIGNEKIDSSELNNELRSLGKVKRFNDKQKRIAELETFNTLVGTKSKNINFSILSKELVFKIPDKYNKKVNPDDWVKIGNAIKKSLYEDFDIIYSAVHCDENPENPHLHMSLSGKNNKTGLFDIQDSLIKTLSKNKGYPFKNRKYSSLNKEEIKIHGEFYQDIVFHKMNFYLNKLDYEFELTKKTKQEKKNENITYKDQKKSSVNREHNRQNKVKIEIKQANKELNETKFKNSELNGEIEKKQINVNMLDKKVSGLKDKLTDLEKAIQLAEKCYTSLISFLKDRLPPDLFNFVNNFEMLYKKNKKVANELEKETNRIADDETKNAIKKNCKSFKLR